MSPKPDFRYYLRVRFSECDAQKVVFNARYGEYADVAVSEFLRALGYGEQMVSGELDFQLVRQTTEWKASLRYDQVVEISVRAAKLGNTSFTIVCEYRRAGENELTASTETVYVLVEQGSQIKRVLPDELRTRLEQGARGQSADHAQWLRKD